MISELKKSTKITNYPWNNKNWYQNGMRVQYRFRSACASVQIDQRFRWHHLTCLKHEFLATNWVYGEDWITFVYTKAGLSVSRRITHDVVYLIKRPRTATIIDHCMLLWPSKRNINLWQRSLNYYTWYRKNILTIYTEFHCQRNFIFFAHLLKFQTIWNLLCPSIIWTTLTNPRFKCACTNNRLREKFIFRTSHVQARGFSKP